MGRAPCCDKANVKRGPWSPEEDTQLKDYIEKHSTGGNWIALPQKAGLRRCGKSCRLRWLNYLRPNIKHGDFTDDEDRIIYSLFASIGSRWSIIAGQLPGRTDNDIKNYWNTKLKKKLIASQKRPPQSSSSVSILDPPKSSMTSSPYPAPSTRSVSNYYTNIPTRPFIGYNETLSIPPSILNANSCDSSNLSASNSVLETTQECYNMGFIDINFQLQQDMNFLRFGGDQASCSSSDGSSTNQISSGKEVEHDYGVSFGPDQRVMNLQSYLCNGVDEINQELIFSSHVNGYADDHENQPNPLDYLSTCTTTTLEEIKQLITTNLCDNFFVDENNKDQKSSTSDHDADRFAGSIRGDFN